MAQIAESDPTVYPAGLSARKVEVLRQVAAGLPNAEIAGCLYLSPTTINAHHLSETGRGVA
jgi:DNA-binding CsgD family transcriptional regulator